MKRSANKILHIICNDKFIDHFYNLINQQFNKDCHSFIYLNDASPEEYPIPEAKNVININNQFIGPKKIWGLIKFIKPHFCHADKVIIHGLFSINLIRFLFFYQYFLKKCFWVMWGGDLYAPQLSKSKSLKARINLFIAKKVKGKFKGYVTYLRGDFELAQKLYNAKGEFHECIMYPSNLYKEFQLPKKHSNIRTILVGNSADISNLHAEIFNKLSSLEDQNFEIICPLSYGSKKYAKYVSELGISMFSGRFKPLMTFMPFEDYLKLLSEVDIAIFAHKRQQAMGNTITLLGQGKTVYMRNDVTPFTLFKELDISVFDFNEFELGLCDELTVNKNQKNVKNYFSEKNLVKQLQNIFED
ncbi:TDP-N-acetylfucosamine:lipid II N-acetylfucosaminyltransferase [Thalassotalea fonticola]|uniref:TDP-N-acetylfucosamine:lipid II N-acetylfucosaminyltransferase n=1 Tax=Thalassotalea fonticola TaxID=3065649 RepID=A0ABZ0GT43_9GAMM|nr:TDP-N-acetylfucosamine:lipid II N-acetylfucosaminyltransferase [Colwelliaceae bacterium S1-1]